MVLSDNGDHPMTKLSDTQLVILSAAAQRADLSVLPLPDSLTLKGGALNKVMDSLRNRGLIRVLGGDGGPERVVITSEGMAAIGVEADDDEAPAAADTAPTSAEADSAADAPAPASEAERRGQAGQAQGGQGQGKAKPHRPPAQPRPAASRPKPTPRAGTKQAQMIELLKRPEGATVEQIAAATGWQHHTIRGAISGALKKKLGLTVEATRTREVGPNKTGAKGSSTVYRIVRLARPTRPANVYAAAASRPAAISSASARRRHIRQPEHPPRMLSHRTRSVRWRCRRSHSAFWSRTKPRVLY